MAELSYKLARSPARCTVVVVKCEMRIHVCERTSENFRSQAHTNTTESRHRRECLNYRHSADELNGRQLLRSRNTIFVYSRQVICVYMYVGIYCRYSILGVPRVSSRTARHSVHNKTRNNSLI